MICRNRNDKNNRKFQSWIQKFSRRNEKFKNLIGDTERRNIQNMEKSFAHDWIIFYNWPHNADFQSKPVIGFDFNKLSSRIIQLFKLQKSVKCFMCEIFVYTRKELRSWREFRINVSQKLFYVTSQTLVELNVFPIHVPINYHWFYTSFTCSTARHSPHSIIHFN